jgi:hypothetical protein
MDLVECIMVTIYLIVTPYASIGQTSVGMALRQAVSPFQVKARARNAGAARSATVWRLYRLKGRARRLTTV